MDEYPKYLPDFDVVAKSKGDEDALLSGKAEVRVIKSAAGDVRNIVYKSDPDTTKGSKPAESEAPPAAEPEPPKEPVPVEPAPMDPSKPRLSPQSKAVRHKK